MRKAPHRRGVGAVVVELSIVDRGLLLRRGRIEGLALVRGVSECGNDEFLHMRDRLAGESAFWCERVNLRHDAPVPAPKQGIRKAPGKELRGGLRVNG